jgi:hypothetical protein
MAIAPGCLFIAGPPAIGAVAGAGIGSISCHSSEHCPVTKGAIIGLVAGVVVDAIFVAAFVSALDHQSFGPTDRQIP